MAILQDKLRNAQQESIKNGMIHSIYQGQDCDAQGEAHCDKNSRSEGKNAGGIEADEAAKTEVGTCSALVPPSPIACGPVVKHLILLPPAVTSPVQCANSHSSLCLHQP
eukprot:750728-Hanusia_phi.AAC.1